MKYICNISGEEKEISVTELELRKKLDLLNPNISPKYIFRELGAFWHHFALHQRKSDFSGKLIISPFSEKCPYPVWDKTEWIENSNPPIFNFDNLKDFWSQIWDLFRRCPIPHNMGLNNENCDYCDDTWYSKNCYLSHSILRSEDIHYCYRCVELNNCQFCVFSFVSELSIDLTYCENMYNVRYAINSKNCRDSSFLYDCRNCNDCFLSWNLRNKKYCIANKQYTKEEYFEKMKEWDLSSRNIYEYAKNLLNEYIEKYALHRSLNIEKCENSYGDYIQNDKNCENCFFISNSEDCFNVMRSGWMKDCIDVISSFECELIAYSSNVQNSSYDVKFSYNLSESKFMEYCAHCIQCENCFLSCGLYKKKYCILNKEYSPEDYEREVSRIKEFMKNNDIYGKFFPGYFAANPYEESLSYFHFPLSIDEQNKFGFRLNEFEEKEDPGYLNIDIIPNSLSEVSDNIVSKVFWDSNSKKPFQIKEFDVEFARKIQIPLSNCHYIKRIKDNFSWMFFNGELREI